MTSLTAIIACSIDYYCYGVIRTASNDNYGGGLGTRLAHDL